MKLDTADRQAAGGGDAQVLAAKTTRLKEKLAKLEEEMARLKALEQHAGLADKAIYAAPIPIAARWRRAVSGSGIVGYNVRTAVDTEHHLIVAARGDKRWHRQVAARQYG